MQREVQKPQRQRKKLRLRKKPRQKLRKKPRQKLKQKERRMTACQSAQPEQQ